MMPDQPQRPHNGNRPCNGSRPLNEISHLFLSNVRDQHTQGAPLPQRRPPRADTSIDLTPEEFAARFGGGSESPDHEQGPSPAEAEAAPSGDRVPQISALIGAHLNGRQVDKARQLARYLAHHGQRVGLLELDASEFRLLCFEPGSDEAAEQPAPEPVEAVDPRQLAEALEEMNWDVDQWLLVLPTPRLLEARHLLQSVEHWVLMTTCDHDGVVSAYRSLKTLADLHHPRLSLALLDASDEIQARRVYLKLSGVCQQFLGWNLEEQIPVEAVSDVTENLVLCCRPTRDKVALAGPNQWRVISEFLEKSKRAATIAVEPALDDVPAEPTPEPASSLDSLAPEERRLVADVVLPPPPSSLPAPQVPQPATAPSLSLVAAPAPAEAISEVLDLSDVESGTAAILDAILHQTNGELIECPLRPPMNPQARLAVTRDRHLILLAVANQGLAELHIIGQAYRWLIENRALVTLALPQLAIDPHALPRLRLLVDQTDVRATSLQPLLAGGNVSVQAYRKLRWAGKTGLLLEAA